MTLFDYIKKHQDTLNFAYSSYNGLLAQSSGFIYHS